MEKYRTGQQQADENHQRLLANTWFGYESGNTTEYKVFKADAEKMAETTKRCTSEELLKIARQGRAMTADEAYQILIQDRTAEKKKQHWTEF